MTIDDLTCFVILRASESSGRAYSLIVNRQSSIVNRRHSTIATLFCCPFSFGSVHALWLARDSRPPVWDMAMHQSYALNYWPGGYSQASPWHWSGNYPPFVHLVIALCYLVFHPGPHVAVLANFPATLLLLWGVYELASEFAGQGSGPLGLFFDGAHALPDMDVAGDNPRLLAVRLGCSESGGAETHSRISRTAAQPRTRSHACSRSLDQMALCWLSGFSRSSTFAFGSGSGDIPRA